MGATTAMAAATVPRMMNRQVSASASCSSMNQNTSTPRIGPVVLPTPPMTAMKITSAVQRSTLNAESARADGLLSRITAPVAPVQNAATTHTTSRVRVTSTPTPRAPPSLSRTARRPRPSRDRSTSTTMAVAPTASPTASQ